MDRGAAFSMGRVIDGKFALKKQLGLGAMGAVFLAKDVVLDRNVALKVLNHEEGVEANDGLSLFMKEAAAMARVKHENVVQVHGFGDHEGYPYFVMEYVAGNTVADLIDETGPVHLDVVLGIIGQLSAALDSIHSHRIVHRDVKPANIIISHEYRIMLTDFGVSKKLGDSAEEKILAGTPPYMAPEILSGQPVPEGQRHLADVYAAGVVAFELLTGELPFEGDDLRQLLVEIVTAPVPRATLLIPDLPLAFDDVLQRALAKNPEDRFPSAGAFARALQDARDEAADAALQKDNHVLIVDDDEDMRSLLSITIEAAFPQTTIFEAEDGFVAFELAKAHHPKVCLVDLQMPRVNGLEFCATVLGTEALASTHLVVISARPEEESRQALAGLNIAGIFEKPVTPRQIVQYLKPYFE
jgi:eukaryotic-like serine/threonine-protein kinase